MHVAFRSAETACFRGVKGEMSAPDPKRYFPFISFMIKLNLLTTVWLFTGTCLVWAVVAVPMACGQEVTSASFIGLAPSAVPQATSGGWTASAGRWTPIRRTAFEQALSDPGNSPEAAPTFPQTGNSLESQPLEEAAPAANLHSGGNLHTAETCPECGASMDNSSTGFCGRCLRPTGKLFHFLNPQRWFQSDPQRSAMREPWIYRPFSVGLFMGPIVGSTLIDNSIAQGTGFIGGARFGYDFDEDWGLETRLASASIPLYGGFRDDGEQHSADHFLWDIDFLYYPWGDAAVRPYVLMGIGTARIKFADQLGVCESRIRAGMPVGIGVKWKLSDWFVFRLECLDNVAFAGGSVFQTQHNASLTCGLEIRFGRPHIQYWPWNPGMRQ
jgi:hypothetical protein